MKDASLWYRIWWVIFRLYFRLYHRGRIFGAQHVPQDGGVILAANHVSFLDPPMLGQACPRVVYFLARDSLFRNPLIGALFRSWHGVPIRRDRADVAGVRTILRMLADGKALLMFPEGTRSQDGTLQPARAGIGLIVAYANVPIVPIRMFGAERALPRGRWFPRPARLTIVIGEPFRYPLPADLQQRSGDEQKALYQAIGEEIMRRIAALQPPSQ